MSPTSTAQPTRTKETTMPTTTTAAEARALADQLEAQERELNTRRRAARKSAELAAAMAEFEHADTALNAAHAKADKAWTDATNAEVLSLPDLFDAFMALRYATREQAETIGTANAAANQIAPRIGGGGGQVDYRRDWTDIFRDTSFITALEKVIETRISQRGKEALLATNARIKAAGDQAEEAIR